MSAQLYTQAISWLKQNGNNKRVNFGCGLRLFNAKDRYIADKMLTTLNKLRQRPASLSQDDSMRFTQLESNILKFCEQASNASQASLHDRSNASLAQLIYRISDQISSIAPLFKKHSIGTPIPFDKLSQAGLLTSNPPSEEASVKKIDEKSQAVQLNVRSILEQLLELNVLRIQYISGIDVGVKRGRGVANYQRTEFSQFQITAVSFAEKDLARWNISSSQLEKYVFFYTSRFTSYLKTSCPGTYSYSHLAQAITDIILEEETEILNRQIDSDLNLLIQDKNRLDSSISAMSPAQKQQLLKMLSATGKK